MNETMLGFVSDPQMGGGLRTESALRITDGCCRWTCCITCVIVARIFFFATAPAILRV